MTKSENIVWHDSKVVKEERQKQKGQKSAVVWFTGLSGAGKSTISVEVENELYRQGLHTFRLDGDNVRHGLNNNLGFSAEDRAENIRRVGEVAKLMSDAGLLTLTAFISPYREDRDKVREIMDDDEFIEVYVACDLEVCESRDPKGLYQKARAGEIKGFTGIDDPYEEPKNPELVVHSDQNSLEECVQQVVDYLRQNGYFEA
ncbi:adenylyl-sulfate kinase [Alkalibacillus salilacus]|uniref:Adenylyl-sulfate kinase n=1 Tax=Alkalibacillus salilacus TaxID=284582 RepID=A0ABT9VHV8_9BACI|nr:adenylyl-sulfate kinase [Alkalibacillus salilacus]MDQ0160542.1 adenylylsulfate kinase [Alkalibacillus salilacus]